MKKLINLFFALLISANAFAQGFNVQVCVNITGPQPTGPIIANLTYYSNGIANTMIDTLANIQLPYNYCFPSYMQMPDSGLFAYANGFVQLSSCSPTQVYNYTQFVSANSTITVNAQNCQNFSNCTTTLAPILGTNILIATSTGIGPFLYSWDGGITYTSNNQTVMNGIATYCVNVMDSIGCQSSDCYTNSSGGACQAGINIVGGGPYILTAGGNGVAPLIYLWSTGATTQSITASITGYYCLNIVDANGCGDSACVYLTVGNNCNAYITEMIDSVGGVYLMASADTFNTGNVTYTWSTAENTQSIYPTQPGQYCVYLVYTNTSCYASTCYNFSPGNPVGGCSVYTTATQDSLVNGLYNLFAYPTGTPPFTYNWMFSNGNVSASANPITYFSNNSGVNWAEVSIIDATGCSSSYSLVIPVTPPTGNCFSGFSTYGNYQFGNPGEVFFLANGLPSGASYSWDFGDGTSSTTANPSHIYASTGFYTVCLTTTYNGCVFTTCSNEYVDLTWWNNNPFQGNCTAGFMILTNLVNTNGLINIINTSQGSNLLYTWSFGNGFISNNPLPFTTINNPGVYEICVSILDTVNNCGDTYCDTITIDSLGNVYRDAMSGNMGILVSGTPQPNALLSVFASEKEMTDITIVPNPTHGIFSINADWISGAAIIEIIDITGKLLQTEFINTTKGQKAVAINLQDVANGSYLVRVVSSQRVQTVKLLVNH